MAMKKNLILPGALGLVAAIVYFASMTRCAFPHFIAPLGGILAVILVYHLVRRFVTGEAGLAAAAVAALVFLFTPAVRAAATQCGPRLFDFAWALLVLTAFHLLSLRTRPLFFFLVAALLTFFAAAILLHIDLGLFFRRMLLDFSSYHKVPGWIYVFAFATLPFLTVLFSEDGALAEKPGPVQLLFHGALTFVTVLAVIPPFSPSALMAPYGRLPVLTSAFAATVAGYLVAYWWAHRGTRTARVVGCVFLLALAASVLWNLVSFDARAFSVRRVVIKMDARRAREILKKDPDSPLANYVMGSVALKGERIAEAEPYLRRAVQCSRPLPVALNDLAEVLRRGKNYAEAERLARQCVECAPNLYIGWETLGSVLMDAERNLDEAESAIRKACELAKDRDGRVTDVRMLVSLVRIQLRRGDTAHAQETMRGIRPRLGELPPAARAEFEKFLRENHL